MASISIQYEASPGDVRQHALTLYQAVTLLAGKDFWRTQEIPDLGLASLKWSDGPNGARGENWTDGKAAVCFPCATSLGASFDQHLIRQVGAAIATDSLGKHAYGLLAPTVNIHRYLLNGRNFESYSEDPHLSGYIASAYINGVQSQGVSACPKHFLANEVENGRRWSDSVIDERTLREIYLEPFRLLIKHSSPLALMTAYNACNGEYCSQSKELLEDIVRKEWGFKGLVVSDWFGTYSTVEALNAGLDLEMAGPTKFRTQKMIEDALASGTLDIKTVQKSVQRLVDILKATGRLGLSDPVDIAGKLPEKSSKTDESTMSLLRRSAADGMVLLKNNKGVLPLTHDAYSKISIIGRPAADPSIFGGGSASLRPAYISAPIDALKEHFPSATYHQGVWVQRLVGLASEIATPQSEIMLEWFNNYSGNADSNPSDLFRSESITKSEYMMMEDIHEGLADIQSFSTRMTIRIKAPVSGPYSLSLTSPGSQDAYLDGRLIASVARGPSSGSTEEVVTEDYIFNRARLEKCFDVPFDLEAGKQYTLVIVSKSSKHSPKYINREFYVQGSRIGFAPVMDDEKAVAETAAAVKSEAPDASIVFVGTSTQWESEGFDRVSYSLPLQQNELILAVAKASPGPTIVVINSGSPVDCTPWIDSVDAIVQAWFPGQEYGNALSDVLTGKVSPSGRVPTTVPRSITNTGTGDLTGKTDGPKGTTTKIIYKEGLSVGYRAYGGREDWYNPLFAFGHGLSYSHFTYSDLVQSESTGVDTTITVTVRNQGAMEAAEVVQLYIQPPRTESNRPVVELKSFAKTKRLSPRGGEEKISLTLSREAFSFWDVSAKKWKVEAGVYKVLFAGSKGVGDWIDTGKDILIDVQADSHWLN